MDQSLEMADAKQKRSDGRRQAVRKRANSGLTAKNGWFAASLFLVILVIAGFRPPGSDRNTPLFFAMENEWRRVAGEKFIGGYYNLDTLLEHELYLLSDAAGQPLLFYSDIITPVCIDGICKPVYIELYWNLVGAYAGYGVYEERPLTKFDHDEFVAADHQKLHQLLLDEGSVLSRKKLEELFDKDAAPAKKVEYNGEEIDAVSGATLKEIKESIIEGALYSCYTLWHLVHGQVTGKIEAYLGSIYSEEMERSFLYSGYEDYHFYALKQMNGPAFEQYLSRVVQIFRTDKPLIRSYILKKIPKHLLSDEGAARALYDAFSTVDVNSKTLLVNNLDHAHAAASELLSGQVREMSRNQLKTYLSFLGADESRLTPLTRENLQRTAVSEEYAYGYLIGEFIK